MQRRLYGERQTARHSRQPRPLPWLGKRLLLLAIASGSAGYAFHLYGTWPLGVVAIVTPIFGWIGLILQMGSTFERGSMKTQISGISFSEDFAGRTTAQAIETLDAQRDMKRRFGL